MAKRECTSFSLGTIWRWPLLIGILTAVGLVSALFSDDGPGDALAAVCLAVPLGLGL